jgi:CO/xanthine dehydrogenase FAD-binding subunit
VKLWNRYYVPHTVNEAHDLLAQYNGAARVIAGGTDLLLDIKQGHRPPVEALVDITRIRELTQIAPDGDQVTIGAGVTHTQIVESGVLASRATCLVESCGVVGGPQVRNVGTLGGNVAHALPAADGTTALVVLDAEAEVMRGSERRWVPILDMFRGPGESLLDSTCDLLLSFRSSLCRSHEATAFKRIMRPQGVALPILGCAVWLKLGDDLAGIDDARVCISPVAPVPVRAAEVEAALKGETVSDSLIDEVVRVARLTLHPRASKYRATSDYRIEMIEVLLRRALALAIERARTGEAAPEGVGLE